MQDSNSIPCSPSIESPFSLSFFLVFLVCMGGVCGRDQWSSCTCPKLSCGFGTSTYFAAHVCLKLEDDMCTAPIGPLLAKKREGSRQPRSIKPLDALGIRLRGGGWTPKDHTVIIHSRSLFQYTAASRTSCIQRPISYLLEPAQILVGLKVSRTWRTARDKVASVLPSYPDFSKGIHASASSSTSMRIMGSTRIQAGTRIKAGGSIQACARF